VARYRADENRGAFFFFGVSFYFPLVRRDPPSYIESIPVDV